MNVFKAYHNSHDLFYREPFGAVTCGQEIAFRLRTLSAEPVETCVLRLWVTNREIALSLHQNSKESCEDGLLFEGNYKVPDIPGLIWYYFVIRTGSDTYYYGNNLKRIGGEGALWEQEPPSYQITVHKLSLIHISEPTRLGMISY